MTTLDTYEAYHALSAEDATELRLRIRAAAVRALTSGKPVWEIVPTTDGQPLFVKIAIEVSTPEASKSGGT